MTQQTQPSSGPFTPKQGAAIGAAVHPVLCVVAAEGEQKQRAAAQEAEHPRCEVCDEA